MTDQKQFNEVCCGRTSAKVVLENMKSHCERDMMGIDALIRVIPWDSISAEDEAAIWEHFTSGSRFKW